ncbi:MAG: coproporphyrinogen III oxidase family protein, partial [Campylobacterales bacterium]|nr:coproporphyrinogen III oxidase family protein [Campylobacterales bacterium]
EEATPFEKKPQMSDEKLHLTKWLFKEIEKKGFKQYEISNFGSYRSKHNYGYWEYKDYIGVGSGAVGKLGLNRFYPTSDVESYIKNPLDIDVEELSKDDRVIEQIFLGLRSDVGVDAKILNKEQIKQAEILVLEDKLIKENSFYYNKDFLLADEIALFFG